MKTVLKLVPLLVGLCVEPNAQAAEDYTWFFNASSVRTDLAVNKGGTVVDDSSVGWELSGGFRLMDWLEIELLYGQSNSFDASAFCVPPPGFLCPLVILAPLDAELTSTGARARFIKSITDRLNIYAIGGISNYSLDVDRGGFANFGSDIDETSTVVGAGLDFRFSKAWHVGARYSRNLSSDLDVDNLAMTVRFNFRHKK